MQLRSRGSLRALRVLAERDSPSPSGRANGRFAPVSRLCRGSRKGRPVDPAGYNVTAPPSRSTRPFIRQVSDGEPADSWWMKGRGAVGGSAAALSNAVKISATEPPSVPRAFGVYMSVSAAAYLNTAAEPWPPRSSRTRGRRRHQVPWKVSKASSSRSSSPIAMRYSWGVSIGFLNCGPSSVVIRGHPVLT